MTMNVCLHDIRAVARGSGGRHLGHVVDVDQHGPAMRLVRFGCSGLNQLNTMRTG